MDVLVVFFKGETETNILCVIPLGNRDFFVEDLLLDDYANQYLFDRKKIYGVRTRIVELVPEKI